MNRIPIPTVFHSKTQQFALQVWTQLGKIQRKWLSGQVTLEIMLKKIFSNVFTQSFKDIVSSVVISKEHDT